MPKKKTRDYITAGVNFDVDVMQYLELLAKEEDRPRSHLVNRIVREHAKRRNAGVLPGLSDDPLSV